MPAPAREDVIVSEHDPRWWEATIEVEAFLKGRAREKTVTMLFPSSRDVMWYASPKPQPSSRGQNRTVCRTAQNFS